MTTSGPGIFFDGVTSARHDVTVELTPDMLKVISADGRTLADWPYDKIEALSAPQGLLRIGRRGGTTLMLAMGLVLIVLGGMHFFNLYIFSRMRQRGLVRSAAAEARHEPRIGSAGETL